MAIKLYPHSNNNGALFIVIAISIVLCQGCLYRPDTVSYKAPIPAPSTVSSSACIDVTGIVLGDIIPNATVFLYETSSLNFTIIMREIRITQPVSWGVVNESEGFMFSCLSYGTYALVIPSSSYRGAVGSPLPYEFDCENLSLRIAFQGGDSQYAVGAFSLERGPSPTPLRVKHSTGTALTSASVEAIPCHAIGLH